jgi:plasmid stabilization system protein ParE
VTGASEDGSSVDVAGRRTPASKSIFKDRHIRSAWGVVKRAMRLQDLSSEARKSAAEEDNAGRSPSENVGARSRSVVGRLLIARISGR